MNRIQKLLMGAACLISVAASAQWQWTDKDGRKVFSDRAPPADILDKNIIKRPGGRTASPVGAPVNGSDLTPTGAAAAAPLGAASAPRLGGIDKDLAEKKKKAEEAEVAKRKAEEEKILKAKVENCARAKQAKSSFDAGGRMARTNEKGEREVMDDAARASEMKRIQVVIDSDCK
jgi:hypothetical protein